MPSRLLYSCRWPTCHDRVKYSGYCSKHGGNTHSETYFHYRGAWPGIRAAQLRREPRCRACGRQATDVDHINPLTPLPGSSIAGTHDRANLQSLCHACHLIKTKSENEMRTRGVVA